MEIGLTLFSFVLAYYIGIVLYPYGAPVFDYVGANIPRPLNFTGPQTAYFAAAGLIFFVVNILLFRTGLRKL